ncbi:hypothetical protein BGZ57DRAFT_859762 [Hyaloscypha finlandica]|nr:hypothetical protein BGZ57DRAFT_859762 [Hyaloscypha finlandica]
MQEWYKELGPEKLSSVRVFLGWTSEAQVVLGTQNSFASIVDVSGAFDCEAGRNVKIYAGSTGLGMSGIASLSVNISGTRSAAAFGISGIEKPPQAPDYLQQRRRNGVAYRSVFLFLVQISLLRQPSTLAVLPPEFLSKPATDSGQAAFEISSKFKEEFEASSDGTHNWDMIKSTCHHLFLVSHELRQIYTDARKTYDVAPNFIFGVELLDVALKDASIPVTKARVSGPWAHLAEHKSCIVLFCKNLGQAIVPSLLVELCSKWQSVPSWNNYLVATGASVLHMLQKRTQKNVSWLADKITRDFEYPTVRLHQSHSQRKYSHLGFLLSEAPAADRKGLLQAVQESKKLPSLWPLLGEVKPEAAKDARLDADEIFNEKSKKGRIEMKVGGQDPSSQTFRLGLGLGFGLKKRWGPKPITLDLSTGTRAARVASSTRFSKSECNIPIAIAKMKEGWRHILLNKLPLTAAIR